MGWKHAWSALLVGVFCVSARPAVADEAPTDVVVEVAENVFHHTLENGLTVVVVVDHSLPLATIEICVRNGAYTEPPEYDGLSHLYEHMFFKGNAVIPSQEEYLARQRELGMSWNGTTSTERVNYFFTLTSDRWREGLAFMRDAIRSPLFDQTELEKERIVVLDELSRNESNPYYHLGKAVDELLWYAYPSRKNTIGDRQIIATASREKMLTVQRKFYLPNNSALFIAGDVQVDEVLAEAKALYGDWQVGPDPFVKYPLPEHPTLSTDAVAIVEKEVRTVTVTLNWHGPDTRKDAAATYAADVFSFILDRQGSKFQKALVDSGVALYAGIGYYTQANVGPISITLSAKPDQVQEALRLLTAEIARFDDEDYFTDEEIAIAKTLLEVDDIYGHEKTSAWTHTLSFWWASAGFDYYFNYITHLKAVERADMQRYVRTYIHDKPLVAGVLIAPETRASLGLDDTAVRSWLELAPRSTNTPSAPAAAVHHEATP